MTARLDLDQAREPSDRLSLLDPGDASVAATMKGTDPAHLLLGLRTGTH